MTNSNSYQINVDLGMAQSRTATVAKDDALLALLRRDFIDQIHGKVLVHEPGRISEPRISVVILREHLQSRTEYSKIVS